MNENKCAICGEVIPKDWTFCTPCQRREIKIGVIMQSYGTEQDETKKIKKIQNTKGEKQMKKTLIVIDMQNDFVTGALKNEAAEAIIPKIKKKIDEYLSCGDEVIFTRDTHTANYLKTNEGKHLPYEHCINGTWGWLVVDELSHPECRHINKPTFGYRYWELEGEFEDVELVGTCTGICVVSNALILKSQFPNANITVDASCCACVTPESHQAALTTMKMCQINVIGE